MEKEEKFKSDFLIKTSSNIHYENEKRVLELNQSVLKEYFNVDTIILN